MKLKNAKSKVFKLALISSFIISTSIMAETDISGSLYVQVKSAKIPAETFKVTLKCDPCTNGAFVKSLNAEQVPAVDRNTNQKMNVFVGSSIPEDGGITTYTDTSGYFSFKGVHPGTYKLEIMSDEKIIHAQPIVVDSGDKKFLGDILVNISPVKHKKYD